VAEGTNRNLPTRNTLAQLLALYTDRGGFVNTGILKQPSTKHLESRLEVIEGHTFWDH